MTSISRAARRIALCLPLLALAAPPIAPVEAKAEKSAPASAGTPWLYEGSDVPQDKEWIFGKLKNGVRYAVRKNGVPPDQISVRILVDAGSMYETDAEQGYAHLIEHLTFRESKYLKEGETIPTWQRLGATFGSDTNANTSPTQTVYQLDVPDANAAKVDETFRLLSGMITAPIFTLHGVKTEVPIVLAEMRERGGAQARVADRTRETLFAGQPLASRAPIGTVATLEGATDKSVKAFHDRWYRPDNTVIVVAGDVDPQVLIGKIQQWFGSWKPVKKPASAPGFGEPKAPAGADPANPVGEVKVVVEPDMPRVVNYAVLRPWHKVNDTIAYNQGLMIDRLALALINRRLEAKARAGGSFLFASVEQQDISRSADTTLVSVTPLGDDWQGALRDVRAVIADAMATVATPEEIAREVAEFDVAYKVPVETRDTQAGSALADEITNAVDIRETVANPETVYDIFTRSTPLFTPEAVLQHTRDLFKGTVIRGVLVTPTPVEDSALRAALTAPVDAAAGSRLKPGSIKFSDLPAIGTPGTISSTKPAGLLGIETVELSNGVRVLLWPNDAEPGRILMRVRFGGGYAALPQKDAVYAWLGRAALMDQGFADLDREKLDVLATGRKLSLDFDIDDTYFELAADTRPADMADQLYLMAAKLAMPRWDANPIIRAKAAGKVGYESYNGSPQGVLERDLNWLLKDGDPRYATPTPAELDRATPEGFRAAWEPLLRQGPIEVDMFGDFKREDALAALQKTFGALPARKETTRPEFAPKLPDHDGQPLVLTHRGDPNQAAAVVAWPTGAGRAGIHESRQLDILAQIFNNRLFDEMREKIGASYAPQVGSQWPLDTKSGGYLAATLQLRPEDLPAFFAASDKIASDLAATPPTPDEIARVTEPLKQYVTRVSTGNGFYLLHLGGAAFDPQAFTDLRSILRDYSQTSPQKMQELAKRYLVPGNAWRMEVVPEAKK